MIRFKKIGALALTLVFALSGTILTVDASAQTRRRRTTRRAPVTRRAPAATTRVDTSRTFLVPNGTTLTGVLDDSLSSKTAQVSDRFSVTVRDNSRFDGAVIEGHVASLKRSGRIKGRTEMNLAFDRIRFNGQTYRFAGFVESVSDVDGDTRIDNEGNVENEKSQTRRTGERAAVGTGVGALIGAIAGGGKGAAIGAIVGGGAGAGSVYAQGRDELELPRGSQIRVHSGAPR